MFSFVIYSEEPEFASAIEKQIGASGEARVAAVISDSDQLLEALKSEKPDGLFVDLGYAPHVVLDLLESLPIDLPLTVVAGPCAESSLVLPTRTDVSVLSRPHYRERRSLSTCIATTIACVISS